MYLISNQLSEETMIRDLGSHLIKIRFQGGDPIARLFGICASSKILPKTPHHLGKIRLACSENEEQNGVLDP